MNDFWNRHIHVAPPVCTLKHEFQKKNKGHRAAFQKTRKMLTNCIEILSKNQAWSTEQYILSRMIYKFNCQLKHEKSVKGLKRIEACVKRFCNLDFIDYIETTKTCIEECDMTCAAGFLPTRQMIEYILVKMMGAAALLTRTAGYCVYSFLHVQQLMQQGMFIEKNVIFMSLISRIWALSKAGMTDFVNWYDKLHSALEHFQPTKAIFLNPEDELPPKLEVWLKQFDRDFENMQSFDNMKKYSDRCHVKEFLDIENLTEDVEAEKEEELARDASDTQDIGSAVSRSLFQEKLHTNSKSSKPVKFSLKGTKTQMRRCISVEEVKELINTVTHENLHDIARQECLEKLQHLILKSRKHVKSKKLCKRFLQMGKQTGIEFLKTAKTFRKAEGQTIESKCKQKADVQQISHDSFNTSPLDYCLKPLDRYSEIKAMKRQLENHGTLSLGEKTVIPSQKVKQKIALKLKKCCVVVKQNQENSAQLIEQTLKTINKILKKTLLLQQNKVQQEKNCSLLKPKKKIKKKLDPSPSKPKRKTKKRVTLVHQN